MTMANNEYKREKEHIEKEESTRRKKPMSKTVAVISLFLIIGSLIGLAVVFLGSVETHSPDKLIMQRQCGYEGR